MTTITNVPPYVYSSQQQKEKNTAVLEPYGMQNNNTPVYEEHKLLAPNQMLGAAKMPKPSTIKNVAKNIEEKFQQWLDRYTSRPHKYDVDQWKDNIDTVLDITDTSTVIPDNNNRSQNVYISA